jgi:hypothetical protein
MHEWLANNWKRSFIVLVASDVYTGNGAIFHYPKQLLPDIIKNGVQYFRQAPLYK